MVTKSRLWATVLLISTFGAGAVVGGGATKVWRDRHPPERSQADRGPRDRERGFVATLSRELNLSETQKDSVKTMLRKYDPAFRAVMDGTRPKFDSLRGLVHADIKGVLDREQQDGFTRWAAHMDSVTARRRANDADHDKKEKSRVR
ncbi:MAG: hypothetical protein EXR93_07150 [Gemmatimonadetes bacterium]|nr:hypothetical protein [Gemmatimonadota bacterium]